MAEAPPAGGGRKPVAFARDAILSASLFAPTHAHQRKLENQQPLPRLRPQRRAVHRRGDVLYRTVRGSEDGGIDAARLFPRLVGSGARRTECVLLLEECL